MWVRKEKSNNKIYKGRKRTTSDKRIRNYENMAKHFVKVFEGEDEIQSEETEIEINNNGVKRK